MDHVDERGVSLVELLLTVVIMGIAFIAILSSVATFHRTTDIHRGTANFDSALRTYTDEISAAAYVNCANTYAVTAPSGYAGSVVVKYWDGNADASYGSTCPATDKGAQQVMVTVSKAGRSETAYIVKRKA